MKERTARDAGGRGQGGRWAVEESPLAACGCGPSVAAWAAVEGPPVVGGWEAGRDEEVRRRLCQAAHGRP